MNWVGFTPSDGWREESWSARGERAEALALFAAWHPEVRALIAGTEEIFRWALFDRPPLQRWTLGRVTLLGDASNSTIEGEIIAGTGAFVPWPLPGLLPKSAFSLSP